jgi:hypothetical protein
MKTYHILGIAICTGSKAELAELDKLAAGTHFLTAYDNNRSGRRRLVQNIPVLTQDGIALVKVGGDVDEHGTCLPLEPATAWAKSEKRGEDFGPYRHNHIEPGHAEGDAPFPQSDAQSKAWASARWSKQHGHFVRDSEGIQKFEPTSNPSQEDSHVSD